MRRRTQDRERRTADRAGPATIHTTEKIGPKRSLTPEGFLLCEDVPIARVGTMVYGPNETPIKTNDYGIAYVQRDEEALFNPMTVLSFVGKSVTDDHPPDGVHPMNWRGVTVGTAHNLRQGMGDDADVLLADLLITDAAAIQAVQSGKREVSAGYDADYEQTGPGEGRQHNIIGNHIALVERGRCGPRCAIGDRQHQPPEGGAPMPQVTKGAPRARKAVPEAVRKAVMDKMMDAAEEAMTEALSDPVLMGGNTPDDLGDDEAGGTHVHVHLEGGMPGAIGAAAPGLNSEDGGPMPGADPAAAGGAAPGGDIGTRVTALEGQVAQVLAIVQKMANPGASDDEALGEEGVPGPAGGNPEDEDMQTGSTTEDGKTKDGKGKTADGLTLDSAALETGYKAMTADAEVLVPGFRVPTFDAKALRKKTVDTMCASRRKVLDTVYSTDDGKTMLDTVSGKPDLDLLTMDCAGVSQLFKAAAGAKKLVNNRATVGDGAGRVPNHTQDGKDPSAPKKPMTIADLNAANAKVYPRG